MMKQSLTPLSNVLHVFKFNSLVVAPLNVLAHLNLDGCCYILTDAILLQKKGVNYCICECFGMLVRIVSFDQAKRRQFLLLLLLVCNIL